MGAVRGFYRFACIDGVIDRDPAAYARLPKVWVDELATDGLDRHEFMRYLHAARGVSDQHWALVTLMGVLGLRVSEACNVQIGDWDGIEQGHRVLRLIGKGNKPATIPLPVSVLRTLDIVRGDRRSGPLLVRKRDGEQLDRRNAYAMIQTVTRHAGIGRHVHPHSLRYSYVSLALEAGVSLREVQRGARHEDPRTTARYDRAPRNLDRHAVHFLAAYVAGGAGTAEERSATI